MFIYFAIWVFGFFQPLAGDLNFLKKFKVDTDMISSGSLFHQSIITNLCMGIGLFLSPSDCYCIDKKV